MEILNGITIKHVIFVGILAAIGLLVLISAFGNKPVGQVCDAGYTKVGAVCVTLKEECEGRGVQFFYDDTRKRCFATD